MNENEVMKKMSQFNQIGDSMFHIYVDWIRIAFRQ